jgi:hypothetical protein
MLGFQGKSAWSEGWRRASPFGKLHLQVDVTRFHFNLA